MAASTKSRGVYVLELRSGAIYVGKSEDVEARVQQHERGGLQCAAWVRKNGGVRRRLQPEVPPSADLDAWEQKETIMRMRTRGIDRVRGWEFTECGDLTWEHCATLKTAIFGSGDLCRNCGGHGHFAAACRRLTKEGWLQTIDNMIQQAAPPQSGGGGGYESEGSGGSESGEDDGEDDDDDDVCQRCGRDSHDADSCYARTDVSGNPLSRSTKCARCGRKSHTTRGCYASTHANGWVL